MIDWPSATFNAGLCVAAIGAAAHFPITSGRREGVAIALLLAGNFVFCAAGYSEVYAPKLLLTRAGIPFTTKDTWIIADAIFGCLAVGLGYRHLWAWMLWALALVAECFHGARIFFALDQFAYSDALQAVLWAQLATFYVVGGRHVRNRIADLLRRGLGFGVHRGGAGVDWIAWDVGAGGVTRDPEFKAWLWAALASLAGSLTALSFRPYKQMSGGEILLALFVGTSFALFVGPLVAMWLFGKGPVDTKLFGAVLYTMASGSNILIPFVIKKVQILIGLKEVEGSDTLSEGPK